MICGAVYLITCYAIAGASFNDFWLNRIKPPPYAGLATEFTDTRNSEGRRLHPYRDKLCAHMLEAMGQKLRVTNIANGRSTVCVVSDRGPNRKFWPRREIDLTPPASQEIDCNGMCEVMIEREP